MANLKDACIPHHDWPATIMSVDCTGSHVVLGARKGLGFIKLDNPSVITKKVMRNSKWECGTTEWNPHLSHKNILASVSNQKAEIWRWREGSGVQQQILRAHTRAISDLNWSWYDPQLLSTCSVDQFVYIWDLRDSKKPATSLQAVVGASQVKWNREDRHVLATSHDGDIRVWDLRKGNTPVVYITAHLSKVHGIDWSYQSGTSLATCSNDSTVKLWNTKNPQQPEAKLNASYPVWRARYTPFGHGLVTVVVPQLRRGENSLCLWNTVDMTSTVPPPVHTFEGHTDVVLDFHWRSQTVNGEEEFQLISWSKDNCLRLWALEPRTVAACSDNPQGDRDGVVTLSADSLASGNQMSGSFEAINDRRSSSTPQTLQQEFALINVNIPNVIVEQMDASQRCCTLSITCRTNVTLSIHFPSMYPNNAIPSFEFTPDTTLPLSTKTKLIKTLRETAQNHVKLNQTCLEPCLRQLVSHLEEMAVQEERVMDLPPPIPYRRDPVTYGSYLDAAIPFPRTSGARFAANGLLVCFTRPNASNEPTPRSMSALSAYSNRPGSGPALPPLIKASNSLTVNPRHSHTFSSFSKLGGSQRKGIIRTLSQEGQSRMKLSHISSRSASTAGIVEIRDVSVLMPLHQNLAQAYTLDGNDVVEICKKNQSAAMSVGRRDLVQTWSLLALVLDRTLAQFAELVDVTPWAKHPFGRNLIKSLMNYYLKIHDIQTLGMLACILCHPSLPEPLKPSKVLPAPHLPASKSFTFGTTLINSSPPIVYETAYPTIKRTKSAASSTNTTEPSPSDMPWSEVSMPYASWTPPEFIVKKDLMEELRKTHENNCRLTKSNKVSLLDHFKRLYSDVLYRWNMLGKRGEVLKFMNKPQEPRKGIEVSTRCHYCRQKISGAQCVGCKKFANAFLSHICCVFIAEVSTRCHYCRQKISGAQCVACKKFGLQCSICHVAVRGASNVCIACGHGGHTNHMLKWFETMNICPTGCGCVCVKDGQLIFE